jgi:hypothetical protein
MTSEKMSLPHYHPQLYVSQQHPTAGIFSKEQSAPTIQGQGEVGYHPRLACSSRVGEM